jgi:DNA-3-methyladenine glycosylase I
MIALSQAGKKHCFRGQPGKDFYTIYHDYEWGVPVHDDIRLFEMLVLEGAQAGLSWETILKRRENYRKAFYHFDPRKVAFMNDQELNLLLHNEKLIHNRLKIFLFAGTPKYFLGFKRNSILLIGIFGEL